MHKTIPEIFFDTAKENVRKKALFYKKEGVYFPVTYGELSKKVISLASELKKLNIEKGDRVAILSENRPEWLISDLAIMSLGAITTPLHTTLSPKAIFNVLNHSEAKLLIVSNTDFLNKVLLASKDLKFLKKIIILEKLSKSQKDILGKSIFSWSAILEHGNSHNHEETFLDIDDVCTIIYTSGTTGEPKGVPLTHRNILSNVEAITEFIPVKEDDVFLSFLPLSHALERTAGQFIPILHGATIAYAESAKTLAQNLKEIRPTVLISVPRIFEKFNDKIWDNLNKGPFWKKEFFKWALQQRDNGFRHMAADFLAFSKIRKGLGGRLRLAISGGASLNEKLAKFFHKIGIQVLEGYGLTETSPVISVNKGNNFKFGTVGKAVPETKIKISDKKEILVKGPGIFSGYYKNESETKLCFDENGWFRTGDKGFVDNQGFLTIIGREKDMIVVSNGKNVWPEPIENMLNDDKFVSQAITFGNNQKFISALIAPDWQEVEIFLKEKNIPLQDHEKLIENPLVLSIFKERIEEKVNQNLNDYEKIRSFKLLPQEFSQDQDELTPTLKLRRHIIYLHYKDKVDSMYEG